MTGTVKHGHFIIFLLQLRGDFDIAFDAGRQAISLFESENDKAGIAATWRAIGEVYEKQRNYPEALKYYLQVLQLTKRAATKWN